MKHSFSSRMMTYVSRSHCHAVSTFDSTGMMTSAARAAFDSNGEVMATE